MAAKKYLVRVSESAFMHMTLATIAAYDVPRQAPGKGNSARWNETYGLLWGHKIDSDRESCIYSIEHATIDGHAKSAHSWVLPSTEYRQKLSEVVPAFWPSARLIGEFHSHPYKPRDSFPATPGLSDTDLRLIEQEETAELHRAGISVFLIMSIKGLQKKSWANGGINPPNQFSWRMGRYRLSLTAYIGSARRSRKSEAQLIVLPRHKGWPKYRHAQSPNAKIVTLSAPTGAGIKDFSDFW
jgi:hypothetical protein